MITTAEQYNANLHLIHSDHPPIFATLPSPDNIYNIDVNTREVDAPKFLAIEKDHASETIYFIVDRYVDYMDLATTSCIITYTNANGKTRFYAVPFYDIYTYANENPKEYKIILPWCLDANVAEASGDVEFSIQFFKTDEVAQTVGSNDKTIILTYSLNTLPAKSRILSNIEVKQINEGYELNLTQYQELVRKIDSMETQYKKNTTVFCNVLD